MGRLFRSGIFAGEKVVLVNIPSWQVHQDRLTRRKHVLESHYWFGQTDLLVSQEFFFVSEATIHAASPWEDVSGGVFFKLRCYL